MSRTTKSGQLELPLEEEMAEPKPGTPLEGKTVPECSWKRGGDYCLHPVDQEGDLCPHHTNLRNAMKEEERRKAAPKHRPPPLTEEEEDYGAIANQFIDREVHRPSATFPPSRQRRKKQSKYERQKALIRRSVLSTLESGRKGGLTAEQVEVLYEALDVLGFLQEGEGL